MALASCAAFPTQAIIPCPEGLSGSDVNRSCRQKKNMHAYRRTNIPVNMNVRFALVCHPMVTSVPIILVGGIGLGMK